MGIMAAFAVGYLLGAQGGRERLQELITDWQYLAGSEEVRTWVAGSLSAAGSMLVSQLQNPGSGADVAALLVDSAKALVSQVAERAA